MIEVVTLDNGLKVAFEKINYLRSVSFGIWVKNGSKYETKEENGISHFIEHLLFKGTKNRTAKQIATEIDEIGGHINAFTAKEYTCYYTKTLDTHLDVAIDVLSDMFFNSNFDNEEIKKERNVIIEEIAMYEDSPDDLCAELLQKNVFDDTSLAMPILGTKETISSFNHDTFVEYMDKHYTVDNVVISVAGNFDRDDTIKKIEKYFNKFSNKRYDLDAIPVKYKKSFVSKEKDNEQLHLMLSYEGVGIGDDLAYELSVLGTVLGGGMSSRLFQKVREERGLCYSIYSQNMSFKDIGIFSIYSALNPNNAEELIEVVLDDIKDIKQNKITPTLLATTKEQLKSNYIMGLESSSSRMSSIGRNQLILNKIYTPDEVIQKIDNVKMDSLAELIDKVFNMDKLSLSLVGNLNGVNIKGLGF